jgi:hypothetical protein
MSFQALSIADARRIPTFGNCSFDGTLQGFEPLYTNSIISRDPVPDE